MRRVIHKIHCFLWRHFFERTFAVGVIGQCQDRLRQEMQWAQENGNFMRRLEMDYAFTSLNYLYRQYE